MQSAHGTDSDRYAPHGVYAAQDHERYVALAVETAAEWTALAAVVRPAASEYLYFVAKGDGTHVFSRSYAEHLANVTRYQRSRDLR